MTEGGRAEYRGPVVVALGGNALADDAENDGYPRLAAACCAMAHSSDQGLLVTHGNGPLVGDLALTERRNSRRGLDTIGAASEGILGYRIEQELARHLSGNGSLATLLTQVEVDADDPAFGDPTKPVGPKLSRQDAERLREQYGWHFSGADQVFRRVVPSPRPVRIVQMRAVQALLAAGIHVVCAGGGGIPMTRNADGVLTGVDAVVDKDRASALLAKEVNARLLILATNVDGVYRDWDSGANDRIGDVQPDDLRSLSLPPGTMGAKVEAACEFVRASGRPAVIGALAEVGELAAGKAGTRILPRGTR